MVVDSDTQRSLMTSIEGRIWPVQAQIPMRLGILSDSHDQATAMRHAMDALRRDRRASYIIHCGDLCSPRMLEFLAGEPAGFVFGNCDLDRAGLRRHAEAIGVHCFDEFGEFTMGGREFAVIHGDDKRGTSGFRA